jgi:hypothetical protein
MNEPIVVLKQNEDALHLIMVLLVGFGILAFFAYVLPVLRTWDYSAEWGADELCYYKQVFMFWGFLYGLPFIAYFVFNGVLQYGDFSFYDDHIEFKGFYFNREISLPYNKINVVYGNSCIALSRTSMPSKWKPIDRIKFRFNAIFIPVGIFFDDTIIGNFKEGISKMIYLNPEDGPKAVRILKEKTIQSHI